MSNHEHNLQIAASYADMIKVADMIIGSEVEKALNPLKVNGFANGHKKVSVNWRVMFYPPVPSR